jgi:hypothetical protein
MDSKLDELAMRLHKATVLGVARLSRSCFAKFD